MTSGRQRGCSPRLHPGRPGSGRRSSAGRSTTSTASTTSASRSRSVSPVAFWGWAGWEGDHVAVVAVGRTEQLDEGDQRARSPAGRARPGRRRRPDARRRPAARPPGRRRLGRPPIGGAGRVQGQVGQRQRRGQLRLLHAGVQRDVGRALRRGQRALAGAHHVGDRGGRGRGLGVPDHVVAHQLGLGGGGVDPVDRAALRRVDRAAAAQDEQRRAVAEGVVDGHRGVHQPDQVVHGRHRRGRRSPSRSRGRARPRSPRAGTAGAAGRGCRRG